MTAEQAMDTMNISKDERSKYEELFEADSTKSIIYLGIFKIRKRKLIV